MTVKIEKVRTGRALPSLKDAAPAEAPAKAKGESAATTAKHKADAAREAQFKAITGLVRREQNGIKEPTAGGLCWLAWQACDKAMADLGRTPTSGEVAVSKYAAGLNATNVKVEYSYWRRFHGYPRAALPPIGLVTKADKRTAVQEGKEA
ncbi:hypothetical protein [Xanthobacter tagetidis]|uniref:Uncharacterized protein n=1 Tax=Xanthobacter tagetidis TaxID=60216 RepID=A0A3L7A8Y6_9HYPH|nr:hypothetical protein [Xanthobacter tagetidis]MBB6307299.1 hypothetical protein [Xanthobacter tagetidis]RLP75842.1 hypothetical protein D9R14_16255 [Xanthobacter tagetidis]